MNYKWSEPARANFFNSSHRSRYLACDALINPPSDNIPLYAIQYAKHAQYALYATLDETLIVLATPTTFYLVTSSEMEQIIGHRRKGGRKLMGPDPGSRLDTAPYLWQQSALNNANQAQHKTYNKMQDYRHKNIKELHNGIIQKCRSEVMGSTLTAKELRQIIPRPSLPEAGIPLGTPLSSSPLLLTEMMRESSNPPSRQGGRLQRGGRTSRGPERGGGSGEGNERKRRKLTTIEGRNE
jgi:hypothetical protein